MSAESFECNAPDVVFENFGDEVILLNLKSGRYYSLDPIGMVYWDYLVQGVRPADILVHLRAVYGRQPAAAEISPHLDALLAEFQSEQLVRPSEASRSIAESAQPKTTLPDQYARPALAKFDDVADILLLDPVHDVGDAGWPNPPAEPAAE